MRKRVSLSICLHRAARRSTQLLSRCAGLMALSSSFEGMPNVILEAQAFGVPIVATRVGGTEDTLVEGEMGLLVECDDLDGLIPAMARVLGNRALSGRMGAAGAVYVKSYFDAEEMARGVDFVAFHGKGEGQSRENGSSEMQEGE